MHRPKCAYGISNPSGQTPHFRGRRPRLPQREVEEHRFGGERGEKRLSIRPLAFEIGFDRRETTIATIGESSIVAAMSFIKAGAKIPQNPWSPVYPRELCVN